MLGSQLDPRKAPEIQLKSASYLTKSTYP